MTEEGASRYVPLRHAVLHEDAAVDEVAYLVLAQWTWPDGSGEFCIAQLDRSRAELDDDRCFPSEVEALTYAQEAFGVAETDWQPGRLR